MKRLGFLVLIILLSFATWANSASTIQWRHQTTAGPTLAAVRANQWVADEIFRRTDGRLKIQVYPNMGLGYKPDQILGALSAGVLESAKIWSSYLTGEIPAADVMELPGLVPFDLELRKKIQDALFPYWESLLIKKNVRMMSVFITDPRAFWTKKVVHSLGEFKGLKIRSSGPTEDAVIRALGAVPVTMPFGDIYTATDRGLIDGFGLAYSAFVSGKFYEVSKCGIQIEWTSSVAVVGANRDAFDALPKDIQVKLKQTWRDGTDWEFEQLAAEYAGYKKQLTAQGVTFVTPTGEMLASVRQAGEEYTKIWLKKTGPIGEEMLKKVREFVSR